MRVLWVTDFDYPAAGRDYGAEDRWLVARLSSDLRVTTCHPRDAAEHVAGFDLVVVRNSGPVTGYATEYAAFREAARAAGTPVYNELTGLADQRGKQYLVDLSAAGFPVIPTAHAGSADVLPASGRYVVKPTDGADSHGLEVVAPEQLVGVPREGMIVQPWVEMVAEVSFFFVDHDFQYALSTRPDGERWQLRRHEATDVELEFATRFIRWNEIEHGIQRVDACRTRDGRMLLVELEDLNPYLSLDLLDEATRSRFVAAFERALRRAATR